MGFFRFDSFGASQTIKSLRAAKLDGEAVHRVCGANDETVPIEAIQHFLNFSGIWIAVVDLDEVGHRFCSIDRGSPQLLDLAWSARNCAKPLSVRGCFIKPMMALKGPVITSAPSLAHSITCMGRRTLAARIRVPKS